MRDRENLRFERTRIFGLARRVFLRHGARVLAAGRLDDPRDIFQLTVEEVLGRDRRQRAQPGPASPGRHMRRPSWPSHRDPARPARTHHGARRRSARADQQPSPTPRPTPRPTRPAAAPDVRPGAITARARVVRDPRSEHLAAGEILVARNTDPGWIAVFSNASAIVVERGSLLSHSAIVARELGIPCVVGLKGATDWITDGDARERRRRNRRGADRHDREMTSPTAPGSTIIRYAQLWEDADVLTAALRPDPGQHLVSICSAGDNALALLTLDPRRVMVVDLSPAQLACLRLRIGAMRSAGTTGISRTDGRAPERPARRPARPGAVGLPDDTRALLARPGRRGRAPRRRRRRQVRALFPHLPPRRPAAGASRRTIDDDLRPAPARRARARFLDERFDHLALAADAATCSSRASPWAASAATRRFSTMSRAAVADHVARRIRHAGVELRSGRQPFPALDPEGRRTARPCRCPGGRSTTRSSAAGSTGSRLTRGSARSLRRNPGRWLQPVGHLRIHVAGRGRDRLRGAARAAHARARGWSTGT